MWWLSFTEQSQQREKKRAEAACLLASTTNYEKYTSCFHTILVMLCHHCYHPSYEDTERQFFSIFYVVLCYVCGISVLLFSLQFSQLWLPAIVQKHIGFIGDSELRYVAAFHSVSALNFGLQSAMNSSNS